MRSNANSARVASTPDGRPFIKIDPADQFCGWFFGVTAEHLRLIPKREWIKYRRLGVFILVVNLPIAGLSWGHMSKLLMGNVLGPYTQVFCSTYAAVVVLLLESVLMTMISHKMTSIGKVVTGLRLVLATAVAMSLAQGLVLFIFSDQLPLVEAEQTLRLQKNHVYEVSELYGLHKLNVSAVAANRRLTLAKAALNQVPPEVRELRSQQRECLNRYEVLLSNNNQERLKLQQIISTDNTFMMQVGSSPSGDALNDLIALRHQITKIHSTIRRLGRSERVVGDACRRFHDQAEAASRRYRIAAQLAIHKATILQRATTAASVHAHRLAAAQLAKLNAATRRAWSNNLSAALEATMLILKHDFWAKLLMSGVLMLVFLLELWPFMSKFALRGGMLDRLADLDAIESGHLLEVRSTVSRSNLNFRTEVDALTNAVKASVTAVQQMTLDIEPLRQSSETASTADTIIGKARTEIMRIFTARFGIQPSYKP